MKTGIRENEDQTLISREGFERLYWQLQYFIRISRAEAVEGMREAISHGRNHRNLELRTAREKRHWVEWSIKRLFREMEACQVIVSVPSNDGRVHFGSLVRLHNVRENKEEVYRIVGRSESDPAMGLISLESPVGRALMGKRVGTKVEVATPKGETVFLIREIH